MGMISVYGLEYNLNRECCLVKERDTVYSNKIKIENGSTAYNIFNQVFFPCMKPEEYMYLMCLDSSGKVLGLFTVSHGGIAGTLLNIRGIFLRALLCNASCIITAHNHPSGECQPSKQDRECYESLKAACEIMEIELKDNLIIGEDAYFSFRDNEID